MPCIFHLGEFHSRSLYPKPLQVNFQLSPNYMHLLGRKRRSGWARYSKVEVSRSRVPPLELHRQAMMAPTRALVGEARQIARPETSYTSPRLQQYRWVQHRQPVPSPVPSSVRRRWLKLPHHKGALWYNLPGLTSSQRQEFRSGPILKIPYLWADSTLPSKMCPNSSKFPSSLSHIRYKAICLRTRTSPDSHNSSTNTKPPNPSKVSQVNSLTIHR